MTVPLPAENIYGHLKRVGWIERHLRPGDRIVEVGCGTGYRITLPLLAAGHDIVGCDIDRPSVEAGRELFRRAGLPEVIHHCDVAELPGLFDVAILSEVLEHLDDTQTTQLLTSVAAKLRPGNRLIITVPNGFGWYEAESFLWKRAKLGTFLESTKLAAAIARARCKLFPAAADDPISSSLSNSPHVQRYTLSSITETLAANRFERLEATGSVLVCGQFTNLLLTGIGPVMTINGSLGSRFPRLAAGFYVAATNDG
jgi:SAM-dependent methyltransferase